MATPGHIAGRDSWSGQAGEAGQESWLARLAGLAWPSKSHKVSKIRKSSQWLRRSHFLLFVIFDFFEFHTDLQASKAYLFYAHPLRGGRDFIKIYSLKQMRICHV